MVTSAEKALASVEIQLQQKIVFWIFSSVLLKNFPHLHHPAPQGQATSTGNLGI